MGDIVLTIKKTIIMNKNKTSRWFRVASLACTPFLALMLCCCNSQPKEKQTETAPVEVSAQSIREAVPFSEIDVKPLFNGGQLEEFSKWIGTQVQYPQECIDNGISGRVVISFTVGSNGKITDYKVLRGVHEKLDAEVLRVVKSSPDWTPGYKEGKAVPVRMTLPVNFKL